MDKSQIKKDLQSALDSNDLDKLEALSKKAVEELPKDGIGYYYLAEWYLGQANPDYVKAETCLAKACELETESGDYYVRFADLKESYKKYDDARILYLKALNIEEDNFQALKSMGLYELRVSRMLDKAKEYFEKAKVQQPDDRTINMHLAELYFEEGNLEDALISVNLALTKEFNEEVTNILIKILFALGNRKDGLKVYDSLVNKRPDNPGYRLQFGEKLFQSNVYGEAAVQFKKGFNILGEDNLPTDLVKKYVTSLVLVGKNDEALYELNTFIKKYPDDYLLYKLRAQNHLIAGQEEKAIDDYKKIIEIIDESNIDFEYRKSLAMLLLKNGKDDEAKAMYEKMLEKSIHCSEGFYGLGLIEAKGGNLKQAYSFLKKGKLKGNRDAEKLIYSKMQPYLNELKLKLIESNKSNVSANEKSALLDKVSGSLWAFSDLNSEVLSKQPENIMNSVIESLRSCSLLLSASGGMLVKALHAESFVFSIKEESGDSLVLTAQALDGTRTYDVTLSLKGSKLMYSEQAGEEFIFTKANLSEIPDGVKKSYMRTTIPSDMEFMGSASEAVSKAFFKS